MAGYTVANLIRKNRLSRTSPDAVALVYEDQTRTYAELDERTDRLASGLAAAGFAHGDRAVVLARNCLEWVEAFFAIAKLGGVVVPVNYLFRTAEVAYAVEDSGARWIIVEDELADVVEPIVSSSPDITAVIIGAPRDGFVVYEDVVAAGSPFGLDRLVDVNDLFLLQYTSGTTGYPKAAMHTHATVLFQTVTEPFDLDMRRDDIYLCVPALCWAAGFHDYTLALLWLGGKVVLNPSRAFDPDELCARIERERATIVVLVPSVQRILVASGALDRHDLSSLRITATGAEPVSVEIMNVLSEKLPGCAHVQAYGQSEFPIFTSVLLTDEAVRKVGSAGKATSLCELRVVADDGSEPPAGVEGNIVSRSPATMLGYWNRDLSEEAFVDGWLQTGDRGYVDEEGYLYIVGRKKDMIITGGLNVYPAEVERVILDQPGVAEVAVIGVPEPRLGEVGRAIVVPVADHVLDLVALEAAVRAQIASFKVPRQWELRDEPLPRTASGKAKKFLLKEEAGRSTDQ